MFCQGHQIGLVSPEVEQHVSSYQEVFHILPHKIEICPGLFQYDEITAQIASVLTNLRQKNVFKALEGWRDETYEIKPSFGEKSLFAMERSATCLFGLRQYGVDVNGYVIDKNGDISVWMQKRSINKPTWPGKLDNFVSFISFLGEIVVQILITTVVSTPVWTKHSICSKLILYKII